jgi:hypothetical protein
VLAFMACAATLTHIVAGTFQADIGLRRAAALSVGVSARSSALTSRSA